MFPHLVTATEITWYIQKGQWDAKWQFSFVLIFCAAENFIMCAVMGVLYDCRCV